MRQPRVYLLLLLTLVLKSCEVPDVQPFLRATSEMGMAIEAGLKRVAANLDKVQITSTELADTLVIRRQQRLLEQHQDSLRRRARAFSGVAHALDAYAQALNDVVIRGNKQAGQIKKVSQTFDDLLKATKAFAIPFPALALAPAAKTLLDSLARDINKAHTINQLSQLATPRQDTLVQRVARSLEVGLNIFGTIDSLAYALRYNNQPLYASSVRDLYQNTNKRQQAAVEPLRLISQVRYQLLLAHNKLLDVRYTPHNSLIKLAILDERLDDNQTIAKAAQSWREANYTTPRNLYKALDSREAYYLGWLAVSKDLVALYEAEQARYAIPDKDKDWLGRSQRAIAAWATAHHTLRQALVKAKKLNATDLLRYKQSSQALVEAVKELGK